MPKYPVKQRLNHDNTTYEPGSDVEMSEDTAAGLITLGVIGEPSAELTDDELIARIAVAASVEDVNALVGKIKRKAVVEAADKRRDELVQ